MDGPDEGAFRLGVNYWPAEVAMEWMQVYDPTTTRRDFRRAAAAGFETLRVFLRWEDVQPAASTVDGVVLGHLVDAADAAVEAGVSLLVTLFVGHMSGVNWIPAWATGSDAGDPRFRVISRGRTQSTTSVRHWYGDAEIVDAPARVASAGASALEGHPGLWAWDLGNENSNCTVPPSRAAGEAWLERMATAIRRGDPGRPVTLGIHMEDLEEDRRIGPAEAARWCDFVSMHGYPIYADWSAGKPTIGCSPFSPRSPAGLQAALRSCSRSSACRRRHVLAQTIADWSTKRAQPGTSAVLSTASAPQAASGPSCGASRTMPMGSPTYPRLIWLRTS